MAESNNQGGLTPKQVPMERNLLIALLLFGVVMYVQYAFFTPPPAKKPAASTQPTAAQQTSPPAGQTAATDPTPPPAPATASAPPAANATPEKVEPNYVIKTDLFRVEFTNQGATVKS